MQTDLLDAVYGCLIGAACGDALGAPVEGMYFREIREKYNRVLTRMLPFDKGYQGGAGGTVTDDSVLRHYLCLAIVEKNGRITPDDFAQLWIDDRVNERRLWRNERGVRYKIRQGMNPWVTGIGSIPVGCGTMMIAPIGIINAGNPRQAYQDAFNVASMIVAGHNRDAAATVAAAQAVAFRPGATVSDVLDGMMEYSADIVHRALDLALRLARDSKDVDDFCARYYDSVLMDWKWPQRGFRMEKHFSGDSLEIITAAAGILHLCGDDPNTTIIEAANFGRDCDTMGTVAGGIVGALYGAGSIREDWKEACESANTDLFEELEGDVSRNFRSMAERMVTALKGAYENARRELDVLKAIVGA